MTQELKLIFTNKKYPEKPVFINISPFIDMYGLKKKMTAFFGKKIKPTITDFRLVTVGPPEDDKDDTIKTNYFDEKYNNENAFELMTKVVNIYKTPENKSNIYFRTIQATLSIQILASKNTQTLEMPLAFENNDCQKLCEYVEKNIGCIIHDPKNQIFQNNEKLYTINEQEDLKKYQKYGLIIYLFPIKSIFINMKTNQKTQIYLLKQNKPFIDYLNDNILKQLNITSENLSLQIKNNDEIIDVDINKPVHQILSKLNTEPVEIQIFQLIKEKEVKEKEVNEKIVESVKTSKVTKQKSNENIDKRTNLMKQYFSNEKEGYSSNSLCITEDDEQHHDIIKKIGEGASGITYKVIDTRSNEIMCKKILKIVDDPSPKIKKQAINELKALCSIHHPCICRGIGYNPFETPPGYSDDITTFALFLEYLEYSLEKCLKDNILNDTLKARIIVEIAHGLYYLHKIGLIHRDIKVENVMLNEAFEAKLVDFGLIKSTDELQDSITKGVGTLAYMSPEMINLEDYDYKTDVYSFGILLNYVFVGKLPKHTMRDKLNNVRFPLPQLSPSITQCCIDLISKCTEFDPKDRPDFGEIIEYMKNNSFKLAPNVNSSIVSRRNMELEIIDQMDESA